MTMIAPPAEPDWQTLRSQYPPVLRRVYLDTA